MDTYTKERSQADEPIPPAAYTDDGLQSVEQLISGTRDLYVETAAQVRSIGELAFMELQLAISSLQWWLLALALCGVSSVMACTFLIAAAMMVFTTTAFSPTGALLLMGILSVLVAGCLLMWLKVLARRMAFTTLRQQLTQPQVK